MSRTPKMERLVRAALDCLDDMQGDGDVRVCELAKAYLRVAVEPFVSADDPPIFSLEAAHLIIAECEQT